MEPRSAQFCTQCGTKFPGLMLSCPACHALVYADELKRLAAEASASETAGDLPSAMGAWRNALGLLPPESAQAAEVQRRVCDLSDRADKQGPQPAIPPPPKPAGAAPAKHNKGALVGGAGAIVVLLLKLKALPLLLLTKGKLLFSGLFTKSTFLSMILSLGVYWTAWGWKFALGLVLSIYVHEMGHVAELRRYGIKASAPMFIPGFGALIRAQLHLTSPREEARVGLAGPIWGLGAALACGAVFLATQAPIWGAICKVGAWINLFNLLPILGLDGCRAFRALTRRQRAIIVATQFGMWFAFKEGLLILLAIVGVARLFESGAATEESDGRTFWMFLGLTVVLAALTRVAVSV